MKKIAINFLIAFVSFNSRAQQSFTERITRLDNNNNKIALISTGNPVDFKTLTTFGLYGIGNINTEVFNNLNASGKISGYIRPYKATNGFLTINFAFNKNATNSDTLLSSTFLFPDIGNNAFLGTAQYSMLLGSGNGAVHLFTPFYEFSTKGIKREKDTTELNFTTINHVIGGRYSFVYSKDRDDVVFSLAAFLAFNNIADQDNEDFRQIFESDVLPSSINSLGFKVTFQYNNFQVFADLRHVLGDEEKIPVRSLRGFNSNVGIVFNAEIFER